MEEMNNLLFLVPLENKLNDRLESHLLGLGHWGFLGAWAAPWPEWSPATLSFGDSVSTKQKFCSAILSAQRITKFRAERVPGDHLVHPPHFIEEMSR